MHILLHNTNDWFNISLPYYYQLGLADTKGQDKQKLIFFFILYLPAFFIREKRYSGFYHCIYIVILLILFLSPTGYITNEIFIEWFRYIFFPGCGAVMLLMDNHESHVQLEVARLAVQHNIFIVLQPPHTSHFLQPLDCSFCFLKDSFASKCQELGLLGRIIQV